MAEQRRTLNIPMYDVQVHPEGFDHGDDVIDAEVIAEDPTLRERLRSGMGRGAEFVAGAARGVRDNGARDTFFTKPADEAHAAAGGDDPRVRARQAAREARAEQTRLRAAQAADAKQTRAERTQLEREAGSDPLAKLKLETARAGERYMLSLRQSGILDRSQTQATQREQLSDMHQVYASMMVLQCVTPLRQGLSAQNIVSALGMSASMWFLSPHFRVQVGNYVDQIGDVIRGKIEGRSQKKDAEAQSRFERLAARGKGDQLAARWQKRLDRIEHAERGHRLPFTVQSAAMTEVALAEAAYADMRRPGADPAAIQTQYRKALSALYEFAEDDGLDREEISRSMRVIVGQRIEKDPAVAGVFTELGHGRFIKGEPREVYIEGTTEPVTVWMGDFVDSFGGRTVASGSFSLRPVMGVSEHQLLAAETLTADLVSLKTPAEMNDALSQFVAAASVAHYPEVVEEIADPAAKRRFGKARTIFASMNADGMSTEQQQFAYSTAYVDAVETVQRLRPELVAAWASQFGGNWRAKAEEDLGHYNDMGAAAYKEKHGARPGETPKARSGGFAHREEDIHDADIVTEDHKGGSPTPSAARQRARIEERIHEGELVADTPSHEDAEVMDGELVIDPALEAAPARAEILSVASSTIPDDEVEAEVSAKTKQARARRRRAEAAAEAEERATADASVPEPELELS